TPRPRSPSRGARRGRRGAAPGARRRTSGSGVEPTGLRKAVCSALRLLVVELQQRLAERSRAVGDVVTSVRRPAPPASCAADRCGGPPGSRPAALATRLAHTDGPYDREGARIAAGAFSL